MWTFKFCIKILFKLYIYNREKLAATRERRPITTKFFYLQRHFFSSENKNLFKNLDSLYFF